MQIPNTTLMIDSANSQSLHDSSLNNRIAMNTIATYLRTIIAILLALFSSRWVLGALGVADFGLYSVVGSVVLFVTFLNAVLTGSVSRHFAYSIGQDDFDDISDWFNSAVGIHLVIASTLIVIGWPIGEYVVGHVLTIPVGRLEGSIWVFRVSLISAFISMFSVPFIAMFTAKQRIAELAAWGMFQSLLSFSLAWSLRLIAGDQLYFFAAGMVSIVVVCQLALVFRALFLFNECRAIFRKRFSRSKCKSVLSFASWNLIGSFGLLFRDQGSAILLNMFFGPAMNAAYGIANQVSAQASQLSYAMVGAIAPEITASEGRGDRERMLSLSQRASKFGTFLILFLSIPLIVEMDYVLVLWLHEPPPFTSLFCRLILATFILDRLSIGYNLAVTAHGRIAHYQLTVGTSLLLTLPLAWLSLKLGHHPGSIGIAFVSTMAITSLGRVLWGRRLFAVPVRQWLLKVVWPCFIVASTATVSALIPHFALSSSFARLVIVTLSGILTALAVSWLFLLEDNEREFLKDGVQQVCNRIGCGTLPASYLRPVARFLSSPVRGFRWFARKYMWRNYVFEDATRPVQRSQVNVYYWRHPNCDNIGDLLSKIVVDFMVVKLNLSRSRRLKKTKRLFAIGSIINSARCDMAVWGSGIHHYDSVIPRVTFDIRAVRGPLTRQVLLSNNIPCPAVYGDPALLMPLFYAPVLNKKFKYTVIPHFSRDDYYVTKYGSTVLSTLTSDWQAFIDRIIESELIISGSLHGLILAEAYGVPAILLSDIDTDLFKYEDYYLSTGRSEFAKTASVEEALRTPVSPLPALDQMQRDLMTAFPVDLWQT
jgi:O-antigen/teichoic acid export membrane protein